MPSIARPKNEEVVCYIRRREARQQNLSTIIKNPGSKYCLLIGPHQDLLVKNSLQCN